ncbi:hypothetical protein RvY_03384 [Ramazzottius varieornatus]|uniref:Uncharacterized protein n=1 Tax=Ramazzottius varieornatus TaxID=947166 RepID=A0A1D1UMW4_RAMVA|nr:hypothetical protein RvY_03384 [Ramazzottius varieornatus]
MNSQMGSKTGGMSPMVMALGAAALAGGLYYYFWYIPSGQKAMVAIKDEADKLKHPERVERENREHARDAAAGRR